MFQFKALRSPKQTTTINGFTCKASEGVFSTEDKEIAEGLKVNPNWEEIKGSAPVKKAVKKEEEKSEEKPAKKSTKK